MRNPLNPAATICVPLALLALAACGPEDAEGAAKSPAAGSAEGAEKDRGADPGKGDNDGDGTGTADNDGDGTSAAGDPGQGGKDGADPDACTSKNSSVSVVALPTSGESYTATVTLGVTGDGACLITGFPTVKLYDKSGKLVNTSQKETDENAPPISVKSGTDATAQITYESAAASEGGTTDGVTCGPEAVSATVTDPRTGATWKGDVTSRGASNSDNTPGGMIVCEPAISVGPWG